MLLLFLILKIILQIYMFVASKLDVFFFSEFSRLEDLDGFGSSVIISIDIYSTMVLSSRFFVSPLYSWVFTEALCTKTQGCGCVLHFDQVKPSSVTVVFPLYMGYRYFPKLKTLCCGCDVVFYGKVILCTTVNSFQNTSTVRT